MRRSAFGLTATMLFALAPTVAAQSPTAPVATANPSLRASVGGVRSAANERELGLKRFDVMVAIRGAIAETTVTASFANPSSETLEGEFRMRLPTGAIVTGYALDIGGTMVDGVLVDRPQAKAVYEARVRRRVDPGLAEIAADGAFSTRVFPITPGAGRKIQLRFVTPLDPDTGLRLPLMIGAPSDGWTVRVVMTGITERSVPTFGQTKIALVANHLAERGYSGYLDGQGAMASDLVIPAPKAETAIVSHHTNGEDFVQLSGQTEAVAARSGGVLRVYWDRSRGALGGDHAAAITAIARLITTMRPTAIDLIAFNSSGVERTTAADEATATAWLRARTYRGARSLAALNGGTPAARCVMVIDGAATVDRDADPVLGCPIDVLSTAATADLAWIGHFAARHGGRAIRDGDLSPGRNRVRSVTDRDGRAVQFVALAAAAGRWRIVARAPAAGPLTVQTDRATVITLPILDDTVFNGEAALLASDTLATLGASDQRAAFVDTSRKYSIASPSLAFVVLETPADYLAAEIDPPATYPQAMRDEYGQQRKAADQLRSTVKREWLTRVVTDWTKQVRWWRMQYDPKARPKRVTTSQQFDRSEPSDGTLRPAPVSALPPPAPESVGDITVTSGANRNRPESAPEPAGAIMQKRKGDDDTAGATIEVDAWQPDRPYLELYDGKPTEFDARFLEAEARHGTIPAFYLDTAGWLFKRGDKAAAIEMILSALDLAVANDVTLGIVADRLERYGDINRAIELRERHARLDTARPQPKRLLALALARRAALRPAGARADLTRAVALLEAVALTPFAQAWDGIDMIALMEANALIPRLRALGGTVTLDPRLIALLDVDMRVTIDWTTDATDIDLWVDEPNKERAIYNNPRTMIGGHLSNDMTAGYGPEEYLLRRTIPGTFTVQANVYAPDRLDPNGASVMTAHIIRDFGRATQREEAVDIELTRDEKGSKMIGRVVVPARQ
jgi:hypothetical protein